jgi:hypothetical protein
MKPSLKKPGDFTVAEGHGDPLVCIKGQEGINHVMANNEFGNDLMRMCFEHKNNNEGSLSI